MATEFITQKMVLGSKEYELTLPISRINGQMYVDADATIGEQTKLAMKLVDQLTASEVDAEHFSFLLDLTGLKSADIAQYLNLARSNISQYRRGKGLSSGAWELFRVFLEDYFTHHKVTVPRFIKNYHHLDKAS